MNQDHSNGGNPEFSGDDTGEAGLSADVWDGLWDAHSSVGRLVLDSTRTIVDCNAAASKLLGMSRSDMRGRPVFELTNDKSTRALELHLERTEDAHQSQTCELHLLAGGEEPVDVILNSDCVFEDGDPRHYLIAFFDTQGWKGADPNKLLFEEQMRQSQRLEVLGRLAAGVTHDFNNLLTLITGYSRLLTDQLRDDSQLRRHAEKISKAGSQATELVSQLLSFSRKSQLQSAVININEVILDFETMLRQIVGEDIELEAVLDPDVANIRVNPSQFDQVIMNLATNARDAMPEGGTLTFETSDIFASNPSKLGMGDRPPGRYVKLEVSDNGMGMSDEVIERIFEPFYTTKDVGKGTGLGLATVFSVISQYGGTIDVDSEVGRGTTFEMLFPSAEASVDRESAPTGLAERSTGFETILVVESNSDVRRFASTVLEDYGYHVIETADPKRAIRTVEDGDRSISAIVSSRLAVDEANEDFIDALRESRPGIGIVQVCSLNGTSEAASGIEHLPKPFTPEELAAAVRQVLDEE